MKPTKEDILAVLYGVAYGDAIGMPDEFYTREQIKERFGKITKMEPGQPDHFVSKGFKAGETTDDTAMTILISKLLCDSNLDPDPEEFVRRVEAWAESTGKSAFVIGPSTRKAFDQIKAGVPVAEAGKSGTTNGASMRISPVGILMDYHDEEAFMDLVEKMCMPTHYTGTAISAAAAAAACVSSALRDKNPALLPEIAVHFAELGAKRGTQNVWPDFGMRLKLALRLAEEMSEDQWIEALYGMIGTGLQSSESVVSAVAIAIHCGKDVHKAGILAANAGGDTDTMGAIACSISAALAGMSAMNEEDMALLRASNEFDFEETAARMAAIVK